MPPDKNRGFFWVQIFVGLKSMTAQWPIASFPGIHLESLDGRPQECPRSQTTKRGAASFVVA
jgi:hypothetical protein